MHTIFKYVSVGSLSSITDACDIFPTHLVSAPKAYKRNASTYIIYMLFLYQADTQQHFVKSFTFHIKIMIKTDKDTENRDDDDFWRWQWR